MIVNAHQFKSATPTDSSKSLMLFSTKYESFKCISKSMNICLLKSCVLPTQIHLYISGLKHALLKGGSE